MLHLFELFFLCYSGMPKNVVKLNACIAMKKIYESEEWSSQLIFQFKQLERRSLKKSGPQRNSNP